MFFGLTRSPGKLAIDGLLFVLAWVCAFALRFGMDVPGPYQSFLLAYLPVAVVLKLAIFSVLGDYRSVWRYTSLNDLAQLARAVAVSWVALSFIVFLVPGDVSFPRGVSVIDALLTLLFAGGVRILPRAMRESLSPEATAFLPRRLQRWLTELPGGDRRTTLVIGAGDAGETIVRMLKRGEIHGYRPAGLVDDDSRKQDFRIHGVSVMGTTDDIPHLVKRLNCEVALIAIPSARPEFLRRVGRLCREAGVEVRVLPDLKSIMSGRTALSDIQELDLEALLGREKVDLEVQKAAAYLVGKRILITGAGGSIGSELCRQILPFGPAELILLGRGENSIFEVYNELYRTGTEAVLHQVIGDVINKRKLEGVFERFRPELVFHAGADKHVPLMETNPDEAVLNNILGTRNVLEVADSFGIDRVVCISTDKAVNPTSVMGCCKRVAELLVQQQAFRRTKAVAVRFGNVLGSRGSVIPVFEEQIALGGPVTVTDKDVVRYFMTIPEAVQLVLQAGSLGEGGEIFILEMGEPVRIEELARNVIKLHGFEPEVEIPITYTGLRPGEKLREDLVLSGEAVAPTSHPKIMRVTPAPETESNGDLETIVRELTDLAVRMDDDGIRRTLRQVVPEYKPYPSPSVTTVTVKRD